MASPQDDVEKLLYRGTDILGAPTSLPLTGTSDVPAGATGLPAPSGVGGMAGFAGGAGRPGGGQGGPSSLGLAKGALEAAAKTGKFAKGLIGDQAERGGTGGQSLSDALRGISPDALAGLNLPGADLEAIRGLFGGTGTIPSAATMPGMGTSAGQFDIGGSLADVLRSPFQGGPSSIPYSGAGDVTGLAGGVEVPEAIAGAGGLSGGLGLAGGGAAAIGAILGLLAQATGDPDIAKAAQAVGAAGSAAQLAGAGSTIASAAAGASTGLAAGAGAAFAPITAMMLASTISGLAGGEDPVGEGISDMMKRTAGNYPFFTKELQANESQQGRGFGLLESALPYVQSKEELANLIGEYNNYLQTTQQAPVEMYGEGPLAIGKIPGTTGFEHGQQGPQIDWGPRTQQLAQQIAALQGVLPGEMPTEAGRLQGGTEPYRRLWEQFQLSPPTSQASLYLPAFGAPGISAGPGQTSFAGTDANVVAPYTDFPVYQGTGQPYATYSPVDMYNAQLAGTMSQTPSWDPATGQWVMTRGAGPQKPSDYFQVSPYWQQLRAQQAQGPLARQINALLGGTGLEAGMLTEEERRRAGM